MRYSSHLNIIGYAYKLIKVIFFNLLMHYFYWVKKYIMISTQSRLLYKKACDELSSINQALMKEDNITIPFLICNEIKDCMFDFLQCYIMIKKGDIKKGDTLNDLFQQGAELDQRLKKFDVRWISCRDSNLKNETGIYCDSNHHMHMCAIITNGIKKLVDEELEKLNEKMIVNPEETFLFSKKEVIKT